MAVGRACLFPPLSSGGAEEGKLYFDVSAVAMDSLGACAQEIPGWGAACKAAEKGFWAPSIFWGCGANAGTDLWWWGCSNLSVEMLRAMDVEGR